MATARTAHIRLDDIDHPWSDTGAIDIKQTLDENEQHVDGVLLTQGNDKIWVPLASCGELVDDITHLSRRTK
jgi:hypothetical protein